MALLHFTITYIVNARTTDNNLDMVIKAMHLSILFVSQLSWQPCSTWISWSTWCPLERSWLTPSSLPVCLFSGTCQTNHNTFHKLMIWNQWHQLRIAYNLGTKLQKISLQSNFLCHKYVFRKEGKETVEAAISIYLLVICILLEHKPINKNISKPAI